MTAKMPGQVTYEGMCDEALRQHPNTTVRPWRKLEDWQQARWEAAETAARAPLAAEVELLKAERDSARAEAERFRTAIIALASDHEQDAAADEHDAANEPAHNTRNALKARAELSRHYATALRKIAGTEADARPAPDGEQADLSGTPFPGRIGYLTGTCGHAVAGSEWKAGFRTCERCPIGTSIYVPGDEAPDAIDGEGSDCD